MALTRKDPYLASLDDRAQKIINMDLSGRELQELVEKSDDLRKRAKDSADPNILDDLLPEAYALVREVANQVLSKHLRVPSMLPCKEQIMAAIALHEGRIIEMDNGEGKTLAATLPAYLNSLTGLKVHIATYNDYLARRDAQSMGPLYITLKMSVGVIEPQGRAYRLEPKDTVDYTTGNTSYELVACTRQEAYKRDVLYGTHPDFSIDFLKDNLTLQQEDIVQHDGLDYIILDEADSVLIDLARLPSRVVHEVTHDPTHYYVLLHVAQQLHQRANADLILTPLELTDEGIRDAERLLRDAGLLTSDSHLFSTENAGMANQLLQSLRAILLYKKNQDYVIYGGRVVPIDSYTGRREEGASLPNGVQQAVEAMMNLEITQEMSTIAEISYQHFFRLYNKMAGMTATARERKQEFLDVYHKQVVEIPTRERSQRKVLNWIYRTSAGRLKGVLDTVEEIHRTGQPVLINTLTPVKAKEIGTLLEQRGIHPLVLSAEDPNYVEQEAGIIEKAGQKGIVTVSAKMAGRGTDIRIDDEVVKLRGLYVIGVEKHHSSYMDRQLSGRTARRGNPGTAHFFISLEDEWMAELDTNLVATTMRWKSMEEDMPLESQEGDFISRFIEIRQNRTENYYFAQRQQAYEFDSVLDKQRRCIYQIRRKALSGEDLSQEIGTIMDNVVTRSIERYQKKKRRGEQRNKDIDELVKFYFSLSPHSQRFDGKRFFDDIKDLSRNNIPGFLKNRLVNEYDFQKERLANASFDSAAHESNILIRLIDIAWTQHLARLQYLQEILHLRTNIENTGLEWYLLESYKAFWKMIKQIEEGFLREMLASEWYIRLSNFERYFQSLMQGTHAIQDKGDTHDPA